MVLKIKIVVISICLNILNFCSFNNTDFVDHKIKEKTLMEIKFVYVAKGPFKHGTENKIKNIDYDYWIMKYEVTNKQYYDFLKIQLNNKALYIKGDSVKINYKGDSLKYKNNFLRPKGEYLIKILDNRIFIKSDTLYLDTAYSDHPVTEVTWFGATAFCKYYGFQLPDRFEWEKAARGMTGWDYPWGNTLDSNRANYHNSGDPFDNGTTPVGFYNGQNYHGYQTIDSPSPYGCYDMAGNAWEYTNSTLFNDMAVYYGGGGGYLYHTGAMIKSNYFSSFGYGCFPFRIDRPFKSDGFRCIIK
jgi:formylglycine-generating enzyme required for sulfatase activity